jgi:hypothetical protein
MDYSDSLNRKLEVERLYMTVYWTLICFDEMQRSIFLDSLIKSSENLNSNISVLRKHHNEPYYQEQVNKGIEFYSNNAEIHLIPDTKDQQFLHNPFSFNFDIFFKECLSKCLACFYSYWNEQLENLKRKNAKANRYKYLIEKSDQYLIVAKKYGYSDIITVTECIINEYQERLRKILA